MAMQIKGRTLKFDDIVNEMAKIPLDKLKVTEKFLQGDHWQGGNGWCGWMPETDSRTAAEDWMFLQRGFTPKNVCFGLVKRLKGAVLGKQPDWEVVAKEENPDMGLRSTVEPDTPKEPTELEKKFKEIDSAVNDWFGEKKVHESLKEFCDNKAAYGKAAIRIYIPPGYLEQTQSENGQSYQIKKASFAEILSKIYVEVPHYSCAKDTLDKNFGEPVTIVALEKDANENSQVYELNYLDEKRITHIRQVSDKASALGAAGATTTGAAGTVVDNNQTQTPLNEIEIDLGGNLLTLIEGEYEEAMISEPVKAQQRQVNHAKTMEGYALANINFPETTFINAELEEDAKNPKTGRVERKPMNIIRGIGRWLNLQGVTVDRTDGSTTQLDPKVVYREQADPEKFAKVADNNTRDMHEEVGMLYVHLADSPYPSGDSRIEAMTDYLILLVDYKTLMDSVGFWLLTTVVRLALRLSNESQEIFDKFNVIFSTKLTLGRLSTADKELMLKEVAANLRSKRNYMITCEVTDDPDSEIKVIKAQPQDNPNDTGAGGGDNPPKNQPPKIPTVGEGVN